MLDPFYPHLRERGAFLGFEAQPPDANIQESIVSPDPRCSPKTMSFVES